MSELYGAVVTTAGALEERGHTWEETVFFASPFTIREDDTGDMFGFSTIEEFADRGVALEEAPGLPDGVVVGVHLEAAHRGPDAIAFSEIDDDA